MKPYERCSTTAICSSRRRSASSTSSRTIVQRDDARDAFTASKRTAFRDAQAALLEEGDAQSGAQVLMSVLLAKPSGLRTAALRLATGIVVDANRTAQAWFTEKLKDGEVLRVAADEFRATCNHLERHHRRRRAGQHTALDEELLRGCAWTVKFITSLLVGQHARCRSCARGRRR